MELILGVVLSCDDSGCTARLATGNETLHAAYGSRVLNTVRVRPGQLVAIDRAPSPPQVVWRWMLGEVTKLVGSAAAIQRVDVSADERRSRAAKTTNWAAARALASPAVGDRVYFSTIAGEVEVVCAESEVASAGDEIARRWFPRIETAYVQTR